MAEMMRVIIYAILAWIVIVAPSVGILTLVNRAPTIYKATARLWQKYVRVRKQQP